MAVPPLCSILTLKSPWGWMAAAGSNHVLKFLTMSHPTEVAAIRAVSDGPLVETFELTNWHPSLAKLLAKYAAGKPVDFSDIKIDQEHFTPFQLKVVNLCRNIPSGETVSYGELAALAGTPGAARAVGSVMAKNRYPLVVPCHRVIASGGRLGGFSARNGVSLKKKLLELEAKKLATV